MKNIFRLKTAWRLLAGILLPWCLFACVRSKAIYSQNELMKYLQSRLNEQERNQIIIPYEINAEISQYAKQVTQFRQSDYDKAVALVDNIIGVTKLNIHYEHETTKPAIQVFMEGQANCLSFTSLFIGMARSARMNAVYVDVTAVESLSSEGDVIVHSGHICAGLFHSNTFVLIDFAPDPKRRYTSYKIIDDVEAAANFYNNLGFERSRKFTEANLAAGADEDIQYYKLALKLKPDFVKALNNLGVAYAHRNQLDQAEQYYNLALSAQYDFSASHSNLATLYFKEQKFEKAVEHYREAIKYAAHDFHYHHQLGMTYLTMKNYAEAEHAFRRAIHEKRDFIEAYNGLSLTLRLLNRSDEADEVLKRAMELQHKSMNKGSADSETSEEEALGDETEALPPSPNEMVVIPDGNVESAD